MLQSRKTHNKAQQYAADGRRTPLTWRRCAQRYTFSSGNKCAMKFEKNDLLGLVDSLKSTIELHEVSTEKQDSLLSDILFHVAYMIDEKQGSALHENVFEMLEEFSPLPKDYLVCELVVRLGRKKLETNILKSNIEVPRSMQLNLEVLLGLRDISEIDDNIDTESKFKRLTITRLVFEGLDGTKESYSEQFDSLNELVGFILKVASKWV